MYKLSSSEPFIKTRLKLSLIKGSGEKQMKNVRVLEVEGCRSSVIRARVARVPGFDSPATTKIFSHFSFAFPQTPLSEKVSI